jgi:hypothetical protein
MTGAGGGTRVRDSLSMYLRDRLASLSLLAAAVAAWAGVAFLFVTVSPRGDSAVQMTGALLLGAAVALTLAPLFWLIVFARRRRIAYRGAWTAAIRRGALCGLVVALVVILRGQGAFSIPIALFVVAMATFVELTLTLRR